MRPTPLLASALATLLSTTPPALRAADRCASAGAVLACQDFGAFTASAVRAQRLLHPAKGGQRPSQGLRTTVRVHNHGEAPLVLAYRVGSARAVDDNGNLHAHDAGNANRVGGIGVVAKGRADTQFELAPGQSREFWVANAMPYDPRRVTPGRVYTQDLTLVELRADGNGRVALLRDHVLQLGPLRDSEGR